jgi:hypothetical protein
MIALFISCVLLGFICFVFGKVTSDIFSFKIDFAARLLLGLVVLNTITTTLSLFTPISEAVLIFILILCILLCVFKKIRILEIIYRLKKNYLVIFFSLPFIFIALVSALKAPQIYDSGLYHIQNIKWIEEYSVIPGLANLEGRFGFNANIFSVFAITSLSAFFDQQIFSVNFLLFVVFTIYFVKNIFDSFSVKGISNYFIFNLILFFYFFTFIEISSPSPDFISKAFPLFIFTKFITYYKNKNESPFRQFVPLLIITIYTITVKLTAVPIALLFVFLLARQKKDLISSLKSITIISFIICAPWFIRNIYLSGWLIYPLNIDLYGLDWKVPERTLEIMKRDITGWARYPDSSYFVKASALKFDEWFPVWLKNQASSNRNLLFLSVVMPILILIYSVIRKFKINYGYLVVTIVSLVGVLFVIVLAPDFRFGKSYMVVAAFSPLLFVPFTLKTPTYLKKYKTALFFGLIIFLFINVNVVGFDVVRIFNENTSRIFLPEKIKYTNEFNELLIDKQKIAVPRNGDRCFNHPIPCAPYPPKNLRMRGKTLQNGFYIEKL